MIVMMMVLMHDGDGDDDSDCDSEVVYTHIRMFINIIRIINQPH